MKYILADHIVLRGFNGGKDKVLVDLNAGTFLELNDSLLFLLRLCDGKTDCSLFASIHGIDKLFERALQKGFIREASGSENLPLFQRYCEIPTPKIQLVHWSVTGSCNASCRHCFITEHQHGQTDLSTDEMLQVIQKLADASVRNISLTGGEPLTRKDLPVLLKAMYDSHMCVSRLCTNGFLLDDNLLDLFQKYDMHPEVQISFDGVGHHDWMRRVPGAEKLAIAAIKKCHERGLHTAVSMCVHKGNLHTLKETVQFIAKIGADDFRICAVQPIGDFTEEKGLSLFSNEEMFQIYLDYLPVLLKEKPDINVMMAGFLTINPTHPEDCSVIPCLHSCTDPELNRTCTGIDSSFYISDEGRVLPCILTAGTFLEDECLKLTEHSLDECMNGAAYKHFRELTAGDLLNNNPDCADCRYLHYCGCGCRAVSITDGNGFYGRDKNRCAFFTHGWYEKLMSFLNSDN